MGGGGSFLVLVIIIYVTWSRSLWILMICDAFLKWKNWWLIHNCFSVFALFGPLASFCHTHVITQRLRTVLIQLRQSVLVLPIFFSNNFALDLGQLNIPHFILPQPAGAIAIAGSVYFKVQTSRSVLQYFTRTPLQTVTWERSLSVLKTNSLSEPRVTWLHITKHYWETYWAVIT